MKKILNSPFFFLLFRDFQLRYSASYLGMVWAFVQPVVTVILFWVVFSMGFKAVTVSDIPYIVWLLPGYLAWQYLVEGLSGASSSIVESSYLVQKIVFRVELLPVVKIMSGLVVHIFFLGVMVIVYVVSEQGLALRNIEVVYYLISLMSLMYGLSLIVSALSVFTRDVIQLISMILQVGFWGTPVFWNEHMIPEEYRWAIVLNPMAYIVEGYRLSMIGGPCFWERPTTLYYWVVTLVIIWIGRRVFKRLRPHFADVL